MSTGPGCQSGLNLGSGLAVEKKAPLYQMVHLRDDIPASVISPNTYMLERQAGFPKYS